MLVGDLITWFYENLAGIRPDPFEPGFKHIIMRPTLAGDLRFVKASHQSPHGEIVSDWRREGQKFIWNVTVPVNTVATLYIPARNSSSVTESGRAVEKARGIQWIHEQDGRAVFKVGSGSYRFVSEMMS